MVNGLVVHGRSILDWGILDRLNWNDWGLVNNRGLVNNWSLVLGNNVLGLGLRRVDDLLFNRVVLNSFLDSFHWDVLSVGVVEHLGDIFGLVLNGIVVGHNSFPGNLDHLSNFIILQVWSLVRHVLNSGFSLDNRLGHLRGNHLLRNHLSCQHLRLVNLGLNNWCCQVGLLGNRSTVPNWGGKLLGVISWVNNLSGGNLSRDNCGHSILILNLNYKILIWLSIQ